MAAVFCLQRQVLIFMLSGGGALLKSAESILDEVCRKCKHSYVVKERDAEGYGTQFANLFVRAGFGSSRRQRAADFTSAVRPPRRDQPGGSLLNRAR
jgi:hypothetical protein